MTRLVQRPDWTPVEFVLAVRAAVWEQGVTPETAANRPTVLALFRPAEEPYGAGEMGESSGELPAIGRVVDGQAMTATSAHSRTIPPAPAPAVCSITGCDLPATRGHKQTDGNIRPYCGPHSCSDCTPWPAPVAPPPAEERGTVQVTITPDHTDLIPCRSCGATASPETINALQSSLAALRAENERLKGEMVTAQREAYVIGRRDGRLANNNPAPAKEEVVEGWRVAARNYYPSVPSGENRSVDAGSPPAGGTAG